MLRKKVYNIHNMVWALCKCIPLYVSGIFIFTIAEALLPAAQTLAVAGFVDTVSAYLAEKADIQEVLYAIGMIIICQFGVILLPVLGGMIESVGKQKLNLKLQAEVVHKRSCLEYWRIGHYNRFCADYYSGGLTHSGSGYCNSKHSILRACHAYREK